VAVRPLGGPGAGAGWPKAFPPDFHRAAAAAGRGALVPLPNERALLNMFFQKLQVEDPDAIVAHNLFGFDLDVLLGRALHHKLGAWSKLGRLRRSQAPRPTASGGYGHHLYAGRLMVDTYASARELLRETTYTLSALAHTQLGCRRAEIDPADVPQYFGRTEALLKLCHHAAGDTQLVQRLLLKLQVLPLTKQLTCISGNLWARTCKGNRAERIEYLLMHEFHNLKYITPEPAGYSAEKKKAGKKAGGPSYAGGLVLEPKKGLYDTYILLLDFLSLYPSIIQEFNLCFTTVDWTRHLGDGAGAAGGGGGGDEDEEERAAAAAAVGGAALPPVPADDLPQGVLPRVIKTLVSRRGVVKGLLKKEQDPGKRQELDIRQKALKLTANSMYGCLGFGHSRFYAKPIAALVTAQGRETLQRTVDLAQNQLGLEVIYGDTDSIMVNTHSTDLARVKEIGNQVMRESNKLYRSLELEMDGVFKSMLLLKKKKYAALVVQEQRDGTLTYEKELKGLDLVRRDWCVMSKETGRFVVDQILSGDSKEDIVDRIHEKVQALAEEMRAGKCPLEQYVITKGMNKAIKDYPDKHAQPHLQVAIAMEKAGKVVSVGDHIPYVICQRAAAAGAGGGGEVEPSAAGNKGVADRAYHPDEVRRSHGALRPDVDWYLSQQIVPPLARLCEPIEGTSALMLAQRMGLDTAKFRGAAHQASDEFEDMWGAALKSKLSDPERFRECERVVLTCRACGEQGKFNGVLCHQEGRPGLGLDCPACRAALWGEAGPADLFSVLWNKTTALLRACQARYYGGWLRCDDPACARRTRQLGVGGDGCLARGCRGRAVAEYPEEALHNQLKCVACLVDLKRAEASAPADMPLRRDQVPGDRRKILDTLHAFAKKEVESSAYNWIRPSLWTTVFGGGDNNSKRSGSNNR